MVQASAAVWFGADGFEVTGVREEQGEVVVWVVGADPRRPEGVLRSLRAQRPVQGAPGGMFARAP